ncbi:actin-binding protein WASF1-like [Ochotona princeps]|uniref:actin-binding protein WASF1-like n=1 Tax=Ochotona princeps TaxID=9978 RepID=UPI002714D2E0|nr:actin-binding protein WASF1-like [Ochotona princeps]
MSLNEEDDEGCPKQLAIPPKIQDELAHVIQTSLKSIAVQVNNLNKYAEDLLGGISKEVDWFYQRLQVLQERVIYLTDNITQKNENRRLSLSAGKSQKTSQSTGIQNQQKYSRPLVVKMYETHDACVQTLPLHIPTVYCEDDLEGLQLSHGTSCVFQLCKEKSIHESKEKFKQKNKHLINFNVSKSAPQSQGFQNNASVSHMQTTCGEITNSHANQPTQPSLTSYQFNEISEIGRLLTRTVGKMLSRPLCKLMDGARDLKPPCISYGIGMGEELPPQPQIQPKTNVFVSPMAPNSPPPLPPDWLAALRASKMANQPQIIHYPSQFPSPILRNPPGIPQPVHPPTISEAAPPFTAPKLVVAPPVPELLQCYKMLANELSPQKKEKDVSPPISPSPIISRKIETNIRVTNPTSHAAQPPASSVCPSVRSVSAKSPRSTVVESARSSVTPPTRYLISATTSSFMPLPRPSSPQKSKTSVPLSRQQVSRSSVPSSSCSVFQSTKSSVHPFSRSINAQSRKSPAALSASRSAPQSAGHLIPPQSASSNVKSSCLQPLVSFVQSSSACIPKSWDPNSQALSVSQSSQVPICQDFQLAPSTPPIYNNARSVLMEAIKKGVLLRKTEHPCVLKAKIEIAKNEPPFIQIQHQAAECTSVKFQRKAT